jgi:hypothetical protein
MGSCAKCGGWKPDNCNAGYRNQVCADCQRQDSLIAAQRRAILESTPEGRAQLARERKWGCIKSLIVLIVVTVGAIFIKTEDSSSPNENNGFQEVNTTPNSANPSPASQITPNKRQIRFVVVNVSEGDFLNVRDKPSGSGKILTRLRAGKIVDSSGQVEVKGSDTWIYISTVEGNGWVNGRFLKNIQNAAY